MAVQLALIARFYERIGDHAVNIGEWVGYAVTGALPGRSGPATLAEHRPPSCLTSSCLTWSPAVTRPAPTAKVDAW